MSYDTFDSHLQQKALLLKHRPVHASANVYMCHIGFIIDVS